MSGPQPRLRHSFFEVPVEKIELDKICVRFKDHTVLKDFSLKIPSGQIIGIVGPSGCGKTTIARSICGFINPESGSINIDGKLMCSRQSHVNIPPEERKIGVVFQDYAVWPHLSVYDNIAYPLKKRKAPKDQINDQVQFAMEQVNLKGYDKYMPSQLSGGQQQRVAIARALTSSGDLLIMDEPITNLDAKLREQLLVEIRLMQQRLGTTIIYITHDQEAAMQLCDRIAILNPDGSIAQIGTDEEIIKNPASRFVFRFIGVSNFLPVILKDGKVVLENDQSIVIEPIVPDSWPAGQDQADLGIRPMDIVIDSSSSIRASVTQSVFLGNMYNYFISLGGLDIRVQRITGQDNETECKEGQNIGVKLLQKRYFKREEKA